jgi:hypothetical protein
VVTDPTVRLRHDLHNQNITETTTLSVTTHKDKGGGVSNITENANASFMSAIFWIERVDGPNGTFLEIDEEIWRVASKIGRSDFAGDCAFKGR